jgi:hypothetical protein
MLPINLNTNEVKDASGTEVEFLGKETGPGAKRIFAKNGEAPHLKHRIQFSHLETGSGINRRRRSLFRVDKESISTVDSLTTVATIGYIVLDTPVGAVTSDNEAEAVMANIMSLLATTGAGTTVLFDGTGYGARALIDGSL